MKLQRGIANIVLLMGVVLVSLVIPITRNLVQRGVKLPFALVDDGGGTDPVTPPPPVIPPPGPGPEEGVSPYEPPPPVEEPPPPADQPPPPPVTVNKDCNNRKHKEVWCQNEIEACECRNKVITCDICTYGCSGGACIVKPTPIPTPKLCVSPKSCMNASRCISNTIIDNTVCEDGYVCCERKLITPVPEPDAKIPAVVSPEPTECEYITGKDCDMALPCRSSCRLNDDGCWFCPEPPITPKVTLTPCDSCFDPSQCDPDTMITQTECEVDGLVCCERKPTLQITPTIYCLGGTFKTKKECLTACGTGDCRVKGYCWECQVRPISEPTARICYCDKLDFGQKLKDQLGVNFARTHCSWFEADEIPSKDKIRSDDSYCARGPGKNSPLPVPTSTPRPEPIVSLEECDVPAGYSFPQVKNGSCVIQATCNAGCPSGKIRTYTAVEGNIYRACCELPLPPEISEPSESPSEPPKPVSEPSPKPSEPIIPKPTPNPDGCYCHVFGTCYFMSDSNVDNNGFWKMFWWRLQDDRSRCD